MENKKYRDSLKNNQAIDRIRAELDLYLSGKPKTVVEEENRKIAINLLRNLIETMGSKEKPISEAENRVNCLHPRYNHFSKNWLMQKYQIICLPETNEAFSTYNKCFDRTLTYEEFLANLKQVIKTDLLKNKLDNTSKKELSEMLKEIFETPYKSSIGGLYGPACYAKLPKGKGIFGKIIDKKLDKFARTRYGINQRVEEGSLFY